MPVEQTDDPDEPPAPVTREQDLAPFRGGLLTEVGLNLGCLNVVGVVIAGRAPVVGVAGVERDDVVDLVGREGEGVEGEVT